MKILVTLATTPRLIVHTYTLDDLCQPYRTIKAKVDELCKLIPSVSYNFDQDALAHYENRQSLIQVEALQNQFLPLCFAVNEALTTAENQLLELSHNDSWIISTAKKFGVECDIFGIPDEVKQAAKLLAEQCDELYESLSGLRDEWEVFLEHNCINPQTMQVFFPVRYFLRPNHNDLFSEHSSVCNTGANRNYHRTELRKRCTHYVRTISNAYHDVQRCLQAAKDAATA